tara:strand:- start:233 stop:490 length:258 start_codon:yes stop_codon:yes gene_type:complete
MKTPLEIAIDRVSTYWETEQDFGINEYISVNDILDKLLPIEKQRQDYLSIGFAEWCVKNELFYSIKYGRIETKSLLEIYKKEKGL